MSEDKKKIVIVGASAAGLRCACRLRRLQPEWSITVVEANEVFSYGACGLPYVLSGDIEELGALRRTPYGADRDEDYFEAVKGVEVLAPWRATGVDVEAGILTIEGPDGQQELPWDELVIATGASPRRLPNQPEHPRVHAFHVWDDVKPLKMGLMRGEIDHVAVVGAGLVGCELAEAFHSLWGADVTLIEAAAHPLPEILDPELGRGGGKPPGKERGERPLRRGGGGDLRDRRRGFDSCRRQHGGGGCGRHRGGRRAPGRSWRPPPALPWARAARSGSTKGSRPRCPTFGRPVTASSAATRPLVARPFYLWARSPTARAGSWPTFWLDATTLSVRWRRPQRSRSSTSTSPLSAAPRPVSVATVSVFAACGSAPRTGPTTGPKPNSSSSTLVYDPASRRVVGVQGVSEEGEVAKRIDVAAQLILRGATVDELAAVEHAYAPPYAPALDPLAVLAMAAQNQLDGIEAVSPLTDLRTMTVVDVRVEEEREERPLAVKDLIEIEVCRSPRPVCRSPRETPACGLRPRDALGGGGPLARPPGPHRAFSRRWRVLARARPRHLSRAFQITFGNSTENASQATARVKIRLKDCPTI